MIDMIKKIITVLRMLSPLEYVLIVVVSVIEWVLLLCFANSFKVLFVTVVCFLLYVLCLAFAYLIVNKTEEVFEKWKKEKRS